MQWGLPYALGVVVLLYIHEAGHWLWMRALGLNPKAPMFIPGLGAFVAMTKMPATEADSAWVALAGPLVGGIGSALMYAVGMYSGNGWLVASGHTGFFLNLFQLIPAKPLDGGFAVHAISRWILIPGSLLLMLLALLAKSPLLIVIGVLSIFSWRSKAPNAAVSADGTTVTPPTPAKFWERLLIALSYMGLVGALGFAHLLSISAESQ
jgi:Zn-dependent protease